MSERDFAASSEDARTPDSHPDVAERGADRSTASRPQSPPTATIPPKNPYLAAILSAFPGAGNIYNGLYVRAVVFFLIIASLIALAGNDHPLFGFGVAFFWIFNVLDAYRQATLINLGLVTDLGVADQPQTRYGQGGVAGGAILFVIGLFALVDRYVYVDLDWLIDLWPLVFMGLGGWLIWASLKERGEGGEEGGDDGAGGF